MTTTGFLTDSTLCIGCKACEVACKEWNEVPADGLALWRPLLRQHAGPRALHLAPREVRGAPPRPGEGGNAAGLASWTFSSDVCKHCENAGCLEACPTGAIVRTEFGGVYLQPDVCNGCGYCVVACPFGVVDRRPDDGRAFKCTFCYDRQKASLVPACAKACPTESIRFGELGELRAAAARRVEELRARGVDDAVLYDPQDTTVGGTHAMFIVRGDPRAYNLPARPEVPQARAPLGWRSAALAAGLMLAATVIAFAGEEGRRRE